VIESVKGSTQIQQYKKSIVSSISHYQQIVKCAKEGRFGAMTTYVRRLKPDKQTVCVELCLQLVGNLSLKDLGQLGFVGFLNQWLNYCFPESSEHNARCETQIDCFLKHRQKNVSEFKNEFGWSWVYGRCG